MNRKPGASERTSAFVFFVSFCSILSGCKAPTVNLSTPDPIKVDIAMRLDVYQYSSNSTKTAAQKPGAPQAPVDAESRRRNRMADIQDFKNNRFAGENHEGLVVILETPSDDYGDYIKKTVAAENADRMEMMKKEAETKKTSLPEIQAQRADLWRKRAFKGEWIEVLQPDGSWKMVQKEG